MNLKEIIDFDKKYFMNTFGDRIPVCFDYGKGINLWDIDGKNIMIFCRNSSKCCRSFTS